MDFKIVVFRRRPPFWTRLIKKIPTSEGSSPISGLDKLRVGVPYNKTSKLWWRLNPVSRQARKNDRNQYPSLAGILIHGKWGREIQKRKPAKTFNYGSAIMFILLGQGFTFSPLVLFIVKSFTHYRHTMFPS